MRNRIKSRMTSLIQTLIIWILHIQTARAFQVPLSKLGIGKPGYALLAYAEFTQKYAKRQSKEELCRTRKRMYRIAFYMGNLIRHLLFIQTEKRARKVISWLYQNIGINLVFTKADRILVKSCYFSQFYDPSVCKIMSAMDKGIFAGIFGGGTISFTERITENGSVCRAFLSLRVLQTKLVVPTFDLNNCKGRYYNAE